MHQNFTFNKKGDRVLKKSARKFFDKNREKGSASIHKDHTISIKEQLKKSDLLNKNRGRVEGRWTSENPLEELKNKMHKKPKDVGCKL